MKRIILLAVIINWLFINALTAQNPFKEFGVDVPVITLSKGKYPEFIPNDTIHRIGTVVIDTRTGKIIELINTDSIEVAYNYRPDVASRWISPDPLAEEYWNWSPYNYTMCNPIRYIDPNGMWVGDFYGKNGKYLGTDGIDDHKLYVVTDKTEAKSIKKTNKKGGTTSVSDVSSATLLPSGTALGEAVNVLDRTVENGGLREENSIVMKDGTVLRGETGTMPTIVDNVQTANATLPDLPEGTTPDDAETTIHSHPTTVQVEGNTAYPQTATVPSDTDYGTFRQYGTNIIVGRLGQSTVTRNTDGKLNFSHKPTGAVIYDRNGNYRIDLTKKAINKILNHQKNK